MKLDPAKTLVTAGVLALGLSGGVATAAYAPDITTSVASVFNNIGANTADNGPHGADYFSAAATYIGITVDQLRTELGTDKSLADVAVAHGKTRDGLIQALLAAQQQEIATLVDRKGIGARPSPGPGRPGIGPVPGFRVGEDPFAAAATYLGTTTADLQTKVRAGQTLASIANATPGKSRDGLVAALVADATAKIDAAQKAGTITADQATQLKANLTTREQQFVDSNRPGFGRGFPFGQGGPGR